MLRSTKDIKTLTTHELAHLSYLFDVSHFTTTLREACPQRELYDSINYLWNFPTAAKPILLRPQDLVTDFVNGRVLANPAEWRPAFESFLESKTPRGVSSSSPVIVEIHDVLLEFPISYDGPAFSRNFGRIFRFREDTLRYAARILFELSSR